MFYLIDSFIRSARGLRTAIWSIVANGYGQAITILLQLITIPVFTVSLGTATYGKWLLLSSIPTYLALADGGICAVAANRMSIERERGNFQLSELVFQTALTSLAVCFAIFFILGCSTVFYLVWFSSYDLVDIITVFILCIVAMFNLAHALVDSIFRASGKYALGQTISINIRLLEWLGIPLGLLLFNSLVGAAVGMLLMRLAFSGMAFLYVKRKIADYSWKFAGFNRMLFSEMWRPGLAFLGLPLAFGLMIQGVVIVIASSLGLAETALFGVLRTFSRVPTQLMSIICRGVWPAISAAFARGDAGCVKRLARDAVVIGGTTALLAAFFLWVISPWVLRVWTNGAVVASYEIVGGFMLWGLASSIFQITHTILLSTNKHTLYAVLACLIAAVGITVSAITCRLFGLFGVVFSQIITEIFIGIVSLVVAMRVLRQMNRQF